MIFSAILAASALASAPVNNERPEDEQTNLVRETPVLMTQPTEEDTDDEDEIFLSHC